MKKQSTSLLYLMVVIVLMFSAGLMVGCGKSPKPTKLQYPLNQSEFAIFVAIESLPIQAQTVAGHYYPLRRAFEGENVFHAGDWFVTALPMIVGNDRFEPTETINVPEGSKIDVLVSLVADCLVLVTDPQKTAPFKAWISGADLAKHMFSDPGATLQDATASEAGLYGDVLEYYQVAQAALLAERGHNIEDIMARARAQKLHITPTTGDYQDYVDGAARHFIGPRSHNAATWRYFPSDVLELRKSLGR